MYIRHMKPEYTGKNERSIDSRSENGPVTTKFAKSNPVCLF